MTALDTLPIVLALRAPEGEIPQPAAARLGGTTLLTRLLDSLEAAGLVMPVVVTDPADADLLGRLSGARARILPLGSGAPRAGAIDAALDASAGPDDQCVVVHDAASALTPPELISAVIRAAAAADAAVPGLAVTDSVKQASPQGLENVDRTSLVSLQSPRAFRRTRLRAILEQSLAGAAPDDEVLAAQALGLDVAVVPGSHRASPVTDQLSLWRAQIALGLARDTRIGR